MPLLKVQYHGTGSTFLWLHGFTQTSQSASAYRDALAKSVRLATLDLPGHGRASDVRGSLPEIATMIVEALPDEPVDLGGYSLGGRVALHVALAYPQRIRRLVLLSATRGIEDERARRARRESDEQLAQRLEALGAERFIDEWVQQPLFAHAPQGDGERDARRSNTTDGLASSLRLAGTGTQSWLGERLSTLTMPVLVLAGERDDKFVAEAKHLSGALVDATLKIIDDAGHAAHVDQPVRTSEVVSNFLTRD